MTADREDTAEQALRESEEFNRRLLASTGDCIKVLSLDGCLESMSEGGQRRLGIDDIGPFIGKSWIDLFPESDRDRARDAIAKAATGEMARFDAELPTMKGERRFWDSVLTPIAGADGEPQRLLVVSRDITRRKEVEEALRDSEERLRKIFENSNDAIFLLDPERDEVREANPKACEMFGYTRDEILVTPISHFHPEDLNQFQCFIQSVVEEGHGWSDDFACRAKDGRFLPSEISASPITIDDRPLLLAIVRDVTGRKAVEAALREREEQVRLILDAAAGAFYSVDTEGNTTLVSRGFVEMIGFNDDREALGRKLHDLIHHTHPDGSHYPVDDCPIYRCASTGEPAHVAEELFFRLDGSAVPVEYWVSPILRDGDHVGAICTILDLTERRNSEVALREEGNRLETLNRTFASLAGELNLDRVVQMVTDAGVELTGAQFGAFFYNVLDDAGGSYMLYTLSGAQRSDFEGFPMPRNTAIFAPTFSGTGIVRSDDITKDPRYGKNKPRKGMPKGHLPVRSYLAVPVKSHSGEVIGGLFFGHSEGGRFVERHERLMAGIAAQAAIAMDNARLYRAVQRANETLEQRVEERTGELETANEALRQAQKMEAMGQLTGGVAHDFNNLLTVIRSSADLLRRPDLTDEKKRRYLDAIAATADRGANLTGQLLAFARRHPLDRQVFDIGQRLRALRELLETSVGSSVAVSLTIKCDSCLIEADPNQFETAIINMAVNARDAMDGEGQLSIEVCTAKRMPESGRETVTLAISDTGRGISPEAQKRIFEPFFTTKDVGKGTGLGLAQVYGFVAQSGGEIRLESCEGEGTTFYLCLPKSDKPPTVAPDQTAQADARPGACILVVEDNPEVGEFAAQLLEEIGYKTDWVHDAEAALKKLAQLPDEYDLVFTDIVMPGGMSGIDLAETIRKRNPSLPVVLTSGYSDALAEGEGGEFPLLRKPYSVEDLSSLIDRALKSTGRAARESAG